eukprot:11167643-Lingulodinium_polyedra.AAC.1
MDHARYAGWVKLVPSTSLRGALPLRRPGRCSPPAPASGARSCAPLLPTKRWPGCFIRLPTFFTPWKAGPSWAPPVRLAP